MSVRTMATVFDHSELHGSELLMLLALADYSDDNGFSYPSINTLSLKCRTSPRHAKRLVANLVASGELEVRDAAGPAVRGGYLNLYRVRIEVLKQKKAVIPESPLSAVKRQMGVTSTSESGDTSVPKEVTPMSPKPSENQQDPPVVRAKRARQSIDGQTFGDWYAKTKAESQKVFADTDPVYDYIKSIGLTREFLEIAWLSFKARHMDSTKKQKSWPQTFLNYLRNGWIRVWYRGDDGVWKLNTAGKQIAVENKLNADMEAGCDSSDWTRHAR